MPTRSTAQPAPSSAGAPPVRRLSAWLGVLVVLVALLLPAVAAAQPPPAGNNSGGSPEPLSALLLAAGAAPSYLVYRLTKRRADRSR